MTIIVLIGHIGSGKTTTANILKSHGYIELTFADPIKTFAQALQFSSSEVNGTQLEKLELNPLWRISGREFMQKFGTNVCRDLIPSVLPQMNDLFIRVLEYKMLRNIHSNIVISDCRFLDEVKMAKKYNAIVVKLVREYTLGQKHEHIYEHKHISETSLDSYQADITIYNEGSHQDLEYDLVNALSLPICTKRSLLVMLFVVFGNLLVMAMIAESLIS